jgi:hypothetical protein
MRKTTYSFSQPKQHLITMGLYLKSKKKFKEAIKYFERINRENVFKNNQPICDADK